MLTRFVALVSIWTLIVGCCFVIAETSNPASQQAAKPPESNQTASLAIPLRPVPTVVQQMQELEMRARVAMICYTGRLSHGYQAQNNTKLDPLALLHSGRK
jgi:hypothetical protein